MNIQYPSPPSPQFDPNDWKEHTLDSPPHRGPFIEFYPQIAFGISLSRHSGHIAFLCWVIGIDW